MFSRAKEKKGDTNHSNGKKQTKQHRTRSELPLATFMPEIHWPGMRTKKKQKQPENEEQNEDDNKSSEPATSE
jgi:hypothetical protein